MTDWSGFFLYFIFFSFLIWLSFFSQRLLSNCKITDIKKSPIEEFDTRGDMTNAVTPLFRHLLPVFLNLMAVLLITLAIVLLYKKESITYFLTVLFCLLIPGIGLLSVIYDRRFKSWFR